MQRVVTKTDDGSPTFYVPELNEHYHSMRGAVQESTFVYLDKTLGQLQKRDVRIFEAGFGTGLNAYLTCTEAGKTNRQVCYHSIEMYPLSKSEWLEYGMYFNDNETGRKIFNLIHECGWEKEVEISRFFRLKKIRADLTTYEPAETYDAIYFDAFGPDVQPDLWTVEIFRKICAMMNPGALMSTYSSKGQVRRNIQSAGLTVKRIPGPPGKRQMMLASKPYQATITI